MTAAELQTPTYPLADQVLIAGRYRLEGRIGQGRLGDIFHAVDAKPELLGDERHFAIQVVSDVVARSNSLFNKLRIGYQTLRAADHPNIVRYGILGRDGSNIYLFMERLNGAPLSRLLDDAGTLPLDEALPVLRGVGDALQFLHDEDLVHGNLTAANVFITNELDVRLLDVLPSNAANAIFRGETSLNPTDRATAADDAYALACLAYQMLAGKRPFELGDPSGTGPAEREPERIAGLGDHAWQALRRALTLDDEQPAYRVADFLRDFGVSGTERLPTAPASPAAVEAAPKAESQPESVPEPQPEAQLEPADDLPPLTAREPVADEFMQPADLDDWPDAESEKSGTSPWRVVLLSVLLAGFVAWWYFGDPEEPIVDLIARIDSSLDLGIAEPLGEIDVPVSQPVAAAPLVTDDRPFQPAPAERTAADQPDVEQTDILQPDAGQPAPAQDVVVADAEPSVEEPVVDQLAAEAPAADQLGVQEPAAEDPEIGFTGPVVDVSEQGRLALVSLPPDAVATGRPLVWWTSAHTARADADFVPVSEQAVDLALGDMLTIPLINDDVPEELESFFVDIGARQPDGQIERVATIRVDIVDDDTL